MNKSFKVLLHIYPVEIFVSIGQSDKDFLSDIKKLWDEGGMIKSIESDNSCGLDKIEHAAALFQLFNCGVGVFRFSKKPTDEIIVHECFHATYQIMDRIGQELVDESQESYAYLIGYMFKEIKNIITR